MEEQNGVLRETVIALACNLDDMTAEDIGFAMERLLDGGALDVYTETIFMKKNRPGVKLTVLCREAQREKMVKLLFLHTSTLGVREQEMTRYALSRRMETVQTPYGPVRKKTAEGCGVRKEKYEYDDLAAIARESGLCMAEVRRIAEAQDQNAQKTDAI